jgi:hypothetical protein
MERTYRGQKFVMVEVDTETYDDCLKKGTDTVQNVMTGEDEERIDENRVLRLLMMKCIQSPKINSIGELGARLTRQLERDVRELHFGLEPMTGTDSKKQDDAEDDDSPNDGDDA